MTRIAEILTTFDYGPSPEDASVARGWLARHARGFGHFIDGAFLPPGETLPVTDPATGAELARVSQGTEADVERAVKAARTAQPKWAALDGHDRARHLYALARHLQQHARLLAVLEVLDSGKPIREARDIDLPLAIRHFYHHAGWAATLADDFPGQAPHGVCGQVIPWNFPLLMLAWKVAPALAAGNTVVLKPAEWTPLSALAFAEIAREAGLPKGVLNIVTGDGTTGAALTGHPGIDKVAFTGSTEVGRLIRRQTAGTGKALTLELGGKSPFVVMADADLDAAVEGVVESIWFNQGEVCCAGSRILVAEAVAPRFEALLRARMGKLRTGDPLDKSTDIGAIVHPVQLDRIRALVDRGEAEGAVLHRGSAPAEGCFYPPTLATGVEPASVLATEEIFGPVVTLTPFRTPEDAVALANATRYGLAASIWSESLTVALDLAARIRAGVVWVNCANLFDAAAPFGGMRDSGFGREGGREGMAAYLAPPAARARKGEALPPAPQALPAAEIVPGTLDRTAKLYISGKQARPDGGHSYPVAAEQGSGGKGAAGLAPLGGRKDIRNAVEAARKAEGWSNSSGHARAQVLYYLAENLSARAAEFADRLRAMGANAGAARAEVDCALRRIVWYAAQADRIDGAARQIGPGLTAITRAEPVGVIGIACPLAAPLAGFVSLVLPAIAAGNRVVAIPSQTQPLAATDLYQVFDTSDLPGGVVNIVTGERDALARVLADHDDVDAVWYAGTAQGAAMVEAASAGNLKRTWVEDGAARDWTGPAGQGRDFLTRATEVKTVWLPYGA
ncbi:aldehyde dehydrogenase family protein [Frigidibacter oleivorans]|uniref:aldehyde dehydrogenase family protein n=1 Tax=Frigidibacter oleivorans TaxID=2487129 RepID=UPI000F8D6429|nr:aldehyde dehydrogenase family protein [Frigidibacter oleivorans]